MTRTTPTPPRNPRGRGLASGCPRAQWVQANLHSERRCWPRRRRPWRLGTCRRGLAQPWRTSLPCAPFPVLQRYQRLPRQHPGDESLPWRWAPGDYLLPRFDPPGGDLMYTPGQRRPVPTLYERMTYPLRSNTVHPRPFGLRPSPRNRWRHRQNAPPPGRVRVIPRRRANQAFQHRRGRLPGLLARLAEVPLGRKCHLGRLTTAARQAPPRG